MGMEEGRESKGQRNWREEMEKWKKRKEGRKIFPGGKREQKKPVTLAPGTCLLLQLHTAR